MERWTWSILVLAVSPVSLSAQQGPLTVTFAGDLMAHFRNQNMPDYADIYRALAPWLLTDDLSFVNLETPIDAARPPSDYPSFNARPAYLEAAIRGGFDVFSLANNHANDYGTSSVNGTLAAFDALERQYDIAWSGLKWAADLPISLTVIEKKRWRIGFVALTNVINQDTAADRVNLVRLWDVWTGRQNPGAVDALLEQIGRWKTVVDVLVVSLHDGVEYARAPSPAQIDIYRRIVLAGADVLWCTHPHVLLPWDWVATPRGRRVVMFSMGNFVSRQTSLLTPGDADSPDARKGDGALLRITFSKRPKTGLRLSAEPILTNNFTDPRKGTVAAPTAVLADEAPGAWKGYFRHRLAAQKAWLTPGGL